MNILGLVASERKLGNSEILAKEMLSSLNGEKRLLRLSDLSIEICHACYACLPKGNTCIIQDDLAFFFEQLAWADAVVITSPCYFLGAHTSIKLIGDRLISILNDSALFRGKRCVAAVTYGIPGWEGYAREMVMNFARFLQLTLLDTLLVQAANPGEVVQAETLEAARKLAGRLIGADAPEEIPPHHRCAGCGSSLLQVSGSGQVRCVMCGANGQLVADGSRFTVRFAVPEPLRFSPEGMAEHGQRLETIKQDYISRRKELLTARKPYQERDSWWIQPPCASPT